MLKSVLELAQTGWDCWDMFLELYCDVSLITQ